MKNLIVKLLAVNFVLLVFAFPTFVSAFQNTPTDYANNVTGRLTIQVTGSQTTGIFVTADTYKTPGGSAAVTFPTGNMILRLSRRAGNDYSVEYIGVESASQTSSTVTLGTVTRYISPTDGTSFASQGNGLTWPAGTIVELVWSVQHAENTVFKNNVNIFTGSGKLIKTATGSALINFNSATTTQRNAFNDIDDGDVFLNSTTGQFEARVGGAWVQFSSGSVVNAGYANSGKVECATPSELAAATASGSTGAPLVACGGKYVKVGASTASGYVAITNSSGVLNASIGGTGTGTTSMSSGSILITQGSNAMKGVRPSTDGNVLTSNGSAWVSEAPRGISILATNAVVVNVSGNTGSVIQATIPANTLAVGDIIVLDGIGYFNGSAGAVLSIQFGNGTATGSMVGLAGTVEGGAQIKGMFNIRAIGSSGKFVGAVYTSDAVDHEDIFYSGDPSSESGLSINTTTDLKFRFSAYAPGTPDFFAQSILLTKYPAP